MFHPCPSAYAHRFCTVALIGLVPAGLLLIGPVQAADLAKPRNSLQWVPDNAAFYGSMLRNREQIEAIANSRAWAKLKALPFVQVLWQKVQAELNDEDSKLSTLVQWYRMPENRELVGLAGDMFSHEVFVYGGDNWIGFTKLAQEAAGAMQFGPALRMLRGQGQGANPSELQARILLQVLADHLDAIKAPDMVVGFKLSKTAPAEAQLKRLEKFLKMVAQKDPRLKKIIRHEKIGDTTFLTLQVDGSMVPWDQIPIKDLEEKEGQFDGLVKKLKQVKLTIGLGIRDGYLLVSLGETTAPVARLGQGHPLAERKELRPLAKFADKRLTSVNYVSKAFTTAVANSYSGFDGIVKISKSFVDSLPDKQKQQITKDLHDLGKDLKTVLPQPGPVLSFTFLNGHGYETYTYDGGKYPQRDGSKPLSLLRHAGGNPLLVTVARSKASTQQYNLLVKWIKVGYRYFEEYGVPKLGEGAQEKYREAAKEFKPLVKRLSDVTAKMVLPALADGQAGFVLDAKLTSKQWCKRMPESARPLPMLEPALIFGVSDADLLRKAFGEYRTITNKILAKIHDLAPEKVPVLKIPRSKIAKGIDGTLYFYPIPREWGLDPQLLPNAGLSDKTAVLTISRKHSRRLLTSRPFKVNGGLLADLDRPLAEITHVHCAGLLKAMEPWVDYAAQLIAPRLMGVNADDANERAALDQHLQPILKQVHTVFEVLRVFHSYTSVTYLEDGTWVTHAETIIRDLPEEK